MNASFPRPRLLLYFALLTSLLLGANGHAQTASIEEPANTVLADSPSDGPEDALNRGTPRGSIAGFLEASSTLDFDTAAEFLDLRNLPRDVAAISGPELARQLNHVLSRTVWLDDYTVSDSPEGVKGDGLPEYRDQLVLIETQGGEVPLWMQRVPREDGEFIWKLSNRSVALIPELYDEFSYPPAVEEIRSWFPGDTSFLGMETFKWFILIAVALLCWPILYLIARILLRLFSDPESATHPLWQKILTGPLIAGCILIIIGTVAERLGVGAYAQEIGRARTLTTLVMVWVAWSITNLFKAWKQDKLMAQGRPGAARLVRPITTFIKLTILLLGVLFWLHNIGVNITTVLAGLGIGGVALALALQRPLEDMLGALSLFSQAPIRVGDLCKYGEYMGFVEDIGLRSTQIRTLTNTLVHVPNARLAHVEIENISSREKIRFWPTLRLRYDTTPAQLRQITSRIMDVLQQHEEVYDEPVRVRLTDFGEDAILIKLHSYLMTNEFPESLRIAEELNFAIMDIVHEAGASFALPGRTIQIEGSLG